MLKEPARNAAADQDVLSQLTALRQQLKNEEKRVQQQIDHTSAVVGLLLNYNARRSFSKFCTLARTENHRYHVCVAVAISQTNLMY